MPDFHAVHYLDGRGVETRGAVDEIFVQGIVPGHGDDERHRQSGGGENAVGPESPGAQQVDVLQQMVERRGARGVEDEVTCPYEQEFQGHGFHRAVVGGEGELVVDATVHYASDDEADDSGYGSA